MTTANPTNPTTNEVVEAAELGRAAARAETIPIEQVEAGLVVRVLRDDERIETVDLEDTLPVPHTCRGAATLHDPASFAAYVTRLATESTTLWADRDNAAITAVFDDHATGHMPGWRRHRAILRIHRDPEWAAWLGASGKLVGQEQFAEFLEDHVMAVVHPDAATMLEIATSFQARRHASFDRGTRLISGDVQLRWTETTTATAGAKGQLEVPERFTVRIAPYLGVEPVELAARLRYRISDGQLRIGFALHRPDLAEHAAFERICLTVDESTEAPMHLGTAPVSLHGTHR